VWDVDPAHGEALARRIAGRNLTQGEWKYYLPGSPYEVTWPKWPSGS